MANRKYQDNAETPRGKGRLERLWGRIAWWCQLFPSVRQQDFEGLHRMGRESNFWGFQTLADSQRGLGQQRWYLKYKVEVLVDS